MIYLFFTTTCFSILFFLLLIAKKKKRSDHYFLAVIFLLIAVNSLYIIKFFTSGSLYYYPFFSELNYAIPLMYGPMLWFYAKSVTNAEYRFTKNQIWHFFPFLIFLSILLVPLFINYTLLVSDHVGYPLIKLLITPFYLVSVLLILTNYRIKLKDHFAYVHKMNHMWLSWVTLVAIILWAIATTGFLYNEFYGAQKALLYDYYVLSFLGVFLFVLAFIAFNKTDIMYNIESGPPIQSNLIKEPLQQHSEEFEEDLNRLQKYLEEEKPFLDPLLSIGTLSTKTGIPQYRISMVLNKLLKQSFYDYINGYRVEMVKTKLESGETAKYSILGIALDCGFNSKASFNRIFKKKTGYTPSQYLKSIVKRK